MNDNPLLNSTDLPQYSRIKPEHIQPAVKQVLAETRKGIEGLLPPDEEVSYDSFIVPLNEIEERMNRVWAPVEHLNAVVNSEALRKEYNACIPLLIAWNNERGQHKGLYAAVNAIATSDDFPTLPVARRRAIELELRDFKLAGVHLDEATQERLKTLRQELGLLSTKFTENVLDSTNKWELIITAPEDLDGVPESIVTASRERAIKDGHGDACWKVTLEEPSYVPMITYCRNRDIRRELYEAYVTRATKDEFDNTEIIENILRLRKEEARLLGYRNYAELSLARKMVHSVNDVKAFLYDLVERSRAEAQREFDELSRFAASRLGLEKLEAWDVNFAAEELKRHRFHFSDEDVKPYFPENRVLQGLFEIVHRLYGLDVHESRADYWHPDVRFFEIRDADGTIRGRFFLDLYARPNKRSGAWMSEVLHRMRRNGEMQIPAANLVCNFAPPSGGKPALFTHREVVTLFHEFGHGLHHLLTKIDELHVSGMNGVPWDAIELPSQFFENWAWSPESLSLFARHYETNAPMPIDLLRQLVDSRYFNSALAMVRQLEFGLMDFLLHADYDPDGDQTAQDIIDKVREETTVIPVPPFNRFQNSFLHIFGGGYAAGYYSYKWAEVLAADAFERFREEGIFNPNTGQAFLTEILEKGGSEEPMILFERFRGRKPSIEPLLRQCGILEPVATGNSGLTPT